jgi:sensor histidine kinase YesM
MMKLRSFVFRFKLHHVGIWLVLFALWFYLRFQDYSTIHKALLVTLIKVVDLAVLIYICNYLLVPKLLYRKKYALFALSFILLVTVSSFYKMQWIGRVIHNPALLDLSQNWKARIYDNFIPHFFLVTAGMAFKLLLDYIRLQKRLAEVAREKAEAELNFLKSQINPHFLFNSLNSVYFLIQKENEEARNALHTFSDMLRYQLYECNGDKIPVEKEVSYLKDYVGLQQLRLSRTAVEFHCAPEVTHFKIEPLLLIPFVENSFKHVSRHADAPNHIRITIEGKDGNFQFSVYNTTEKHKPVESSGIGLSNVKKRLELLYPGKFRLKLNETNGWFGVELSLLLNN